MMRSMARVSACMQTARAMMETGKVECGEMQGFNVVAGAP